MGNEFRPRTHFTPADGALAARQWAQWRVSRRRLLQTGAFGGLAGGALVLGGGNVRPLVGTAVAQDAQPKSGGSIAMSLADADASNFDPPIPIDNMAIWTMLLFYDQFVRVAPDGHSIEPGLAETWEASADGLTYTFHLRDATFHDGTPCTAEDAAYCVNRAAKAEGTAWNFILSVIDTVTAPDPKTVVITLKNVWAPIEADLAMFTASIYPKAAHEAKGDELFQHPIGTGPFMFDSWEKDVQIVLKKNPNYWDPPKPYLDELIFKVLPDSNTRMLQFQGGELDIATNVPFNQLQPLQNNPDVTVVLDPVARIDYIGINVARPPFDDKKLRQAMNYAIDKDAIITNVLFGFGEPANTFLPKMAGHDDASPGYPYDLEKAKALVAESAGKDGFSAKILVQAGEAVDLQVCQLVAAALAEIGGKVELEQVDGATLIDRVYNGTAPDFDFCKVYYTTDIIDPDELAEFAALS
ncbi:MAG TPA: ABC transporter substrate-binding protein, partial [Thermomicrobiales bacterium]|nr:ABC transporter substrate-binding protein [Thermomicrobiales bacterium]